MGLVGESGCGKSITTLAIMGLTDDDEHLSGEVLWEGRDLLKMSKKEWFGLRGTDIAMVYQDALSSLNPSMLISAQMKQLTKRGGTRSAEELLELVGLDPKRTLESYPHELSGGQRQRVLIAMALTRDPKLVICDEPTTALDVTVQKQVIKLLNDLQAKLGFAMIFVSHDLALVAEVAHNITVMYAGQVIEQAPTKELLTNPIHEYTRGLLGSVLSIESGSGRLHQVPGAVPSPRDFPKGDRFAPRSSHPRIGLDTRPVFKRVPLCLMFHDIDRPVRGWHHMTRFAAMGYAVLALDDVVAGADDLQRGISSPAFVERVRWGCALAKVARNLDGMDPDCIFAWGEGLGGGVALAVSALDERGLACTAVANPLPGGLEALSSRVRGSVLMGTSLMDAASDPKGQFAVFNGLECDRRHIIYAKYAHERINAFENEVVDFFNQTFYSCSLA